jgi:DNA-binding transcriptional regulator GbsR (MarR family)
VLGAADSEGKLRSELSEAEQWSGKVRAITNAVSQEVGGIKEEMAQLDQKLEQLDQKLDQKLEQQAQNLEQQAKNMLAMKDQLDQKLARLLAAVGAHQLPSE